ncbi:TetR/AcrR family transcriptional regulator [Desulfurobacterium atlanticum]|uniref:Transcriptional regulator, TetR family n=1 Tax=Desulfurobacterium atlanticum TaxID=240169 RepID=A0A238YQ35_9BACT|nr:TetR/AcrR family transcriptional regulator [Desulfurobacterium atlanticum]SNR72918.1 transcriptional regulator, TetR family [Desulfurobacterium atlanticum]
MKDSILRAAEKIFSRYGYHEAKVAMIAFEAGVAVGTIYKFFKSKEELYREVVRLKLFEMEKRIFSAISNKSPIEALKSYIHEAFSFFEENKDFFKFFLQDIGSLSVADLEKFGLSSWYDNFVSELAKILDRGKEEGVFKNFDSKIVMLIVSGAIRNLVYSEAKGSIDHDVSCVEDIIFKVITEGIVISSPERV